MSSNELSQHLSVLQYAAVGILNINTEYYHLCVYLM